MTPTVKTLLAGAALTGLAACTPGQAAHGPSAAAATAPGPLAMSGMMSPAMQGMMQEHMNQMCATSAGQPMPVMPGNEAMQSMMQQHMAMMREMCAERRGGAPG